MRRRLVAYMDPGRVALAVTVGLGLAFAAVHLVGLFS